MLDDVDGNLDSLVLNVGFPGPYFDSESGLFYNYYRYYDPNVGRYVTSDPIGLRGGRNTYSYVLQNPIGRTDELSLLPSDYSAAEYLVRRLSQKGYFDVPEQYNIGLSAADDFFGVAGSTDSSWDDDEPLKVTITDKYFERCISRNEARELLETYIHETLHFNQSWIQWQLMERQDDQVTGSGGKIGDRIHDSIANRARAYTTLLLQDYERIRRSFAANQSISWLSKEEQADCACK